MKLYQILHVLIEGVDDKKDLILSKQRNALISRITKSETDPKLKRAIMSKDEQQITQALEYLWGRFIQMDPTPNKMFIQWIANQYIKEMFLAEDINKVNTTLTNFQKYKKYLDKKDINAYTLHSLFDSLDNLGTSTNNNEQQKEDVKVEGDYEVIINSGPNDLLVISPTDETAACSLGKGTQWCTAAKNNNMFNHYSKEGKLYVLKYRNRKWQLHFESGQFMDEKDKAISKSDIELLSKLSNYTKFLNMLIEKHYSFLFDE